MATETSPHSFASRPIRFITNDGKPYAKRRRINTACNTCRRRKTRCSGEKPFCATCRNNNQACAGYGPSDHARASPVQDEGGKARKGHLRIGSQGSTSQSDSLDSQPSPPLDPELSSSLAGSGAPSSTERGLEAELNEPNFEHSFASLSIRNRMPYFRYFGPTAIMPGFKQMVVKVGKKQRGTTATSSAGEKSPLSLTASLSQDTASPHVEDVPMPIDPPIYDSSGVVPPNPLIIHLCETFFTHLACNYPFLQKERFMRDLEEKQVDPILVDAVCALAARFSNDPRLTGKHSAASSSNREVPPPERGQLFAQRAKAAIPDAFPCPNVAVVQAALLLAYEEFGANRDSGLWMYLGIAIRMAQDLGMQKLEGLKYVGRGGLTPQNIKYMRNKRRRAEDLPVAELEEELPNDEKTKELIAIERERIDTFWAVFHLDRYISSGTGRPVALRDEDIEVAFPALDEICPETGWPKPWPALIRIVHLYGSVSDILNGIKEVSHLTPEVIDRLTIMESNLTDIYQGLSPRLHFNAANFQHYVQNGQGTNFVMLHFWFHTLIVLLHQPTLLNTFDGEMQELFPKSRELALSSAKTIADILAFTEITSAKSPLGNPFTSQPTYVAACAFLKESALHAMTSASNSRAPTPPSEENGSVEGRPALNGNRRPSRTSLRSSGNVLDQQAAHKHTLLAASAKQNYQRCYRALQQLEHYWAGTKYILTVLDQKAKGVWDALLYTKEEMESALEVPRPEPAFTSPGWRRKLSWGAYLHARGHDNSSQAIGWSLTGTMNSPRSANLAVFYPPEPCNDQGTKTSAMPTQAPSQLANALPPDALNGFTIGSPFMSNTSPQSSTGDPTQMRLQSMDPLLDYPFAVKTHQYPDPFTRDSIHQNFATHKQASTSTAYPTPQQQGNDTFIAPMTADIGTMPYGNMMIESQDIDMSLLGGDDMMWLQYLPSDVMSSNFGPGGSTSSNV